METLTTYINESLVFEGIFDKLKNTINNLLDDPKKYFKEVSNNFNRVTHNTYVASGENKDIEKKALDELEKLNNEKSLQEILNYCRKNDFKFKIDFKIKMGWDSDISEVQNNIHAIQKDFKCDEFKAIAILSIVDILCDAHRMFKVRKAKKSNSHSSSRNSSNDGTTMAATMTAAITML